MDLDAIWQPWRAMRLPRVGGDGPAVCNGAAAIAGAAPCRRGWTTEASVQANYEQGCPV